jgi:hypothetical protein
MIDHDRRLAVKTLHEQGQSRKDIARLLRMDVKTVRAILQTDESDEEHFRNDRICVDENVLQQLYKDCKGYVQRMHEKLTEEHGVTIGYSTLTRLVRTSGLNNDRQDRSAQVPDIPGAEMQHDTSTHQIRIGSSQCKLVCSGLYLRYSKMRYVCFYRRFNRFIMKCFIDEALRYWQYCAGVCIIDNTNLAILHGTGHSAVIHPEAQAFADRYGFRWQAHALGHANRKAGKERNFRTIETNFIPGRTFRSLEDLNQQAFQWATHRYALRPQAKTKLIPRELFEIEKPSLIKLPDYVARPYLSLTRLIDQYGYCSFDGNYFWVPETVSGRRVGVLQYADHLRIMQGCHELVRYDLPPDGVKNTPFVPPGHTRKPRGAPSNRKVGCSQQETRLNAMGQAVVSYIAYVKSSVSHVHHRAAFIRWLYGISGQLGPSLFVATITRAMQYRVCERDAILRIAKQITLTGMEPPSSTPEVTWDYRRRPAYRNGEFSEENNIDYGQFT